MEHEMMEHSEILLYSDENGKEFVNVVFMDETFWLTQVGMAELFDSVNPMSASICHTSSMRKNWTKHPA